MTGAWTIRRGVWRIGVLMLVTAAVILALLATQHSDPISVLAGGQASPPPEGMQSELAQRRFESAMNENGVPPGLLVQQSDASYRELKITLRRGNGQGPPTRAPATADELSVQVVERRTGVGGLPMDRAYTAAPGELLLVGVDRERRARWAASSPDPRVVRAESADPDGLLRGEVLERAAGEFVVRVPASAELTDLQIYRATSRPGRSVDLIGTVPLA